ncbi:MAG: hypothetical protein JWR18_4090 [Segetibacter sp.]|jgi:hypothetical protein|nr:hypothetical protein [Segetibacter sp.]
MKKPLFIIFLISLAFLSNAQDSTIALSKFEKIATTAGNFYRIEERILGSVKTHTVTVVKIRNVISNESLSVVRLSPERANAYSTPIVSNSNFYIEKEDIQPLLKSLEYYNDLLKKQDVLSGAYFSYITSTDVRFLCKYEEGVFSNSYLSVSKLYQSLRTPVQFSTIRFSKKDIERLIDLLKLAGSDL